jgi:hypothetical protein
MLKQWEEISSPLFHGKAAWIFEPDNSDSTENPEIAQLQLVSHGLVEVWSTLFHLGENPPAHVARRVIDDSRGQMLDVVERAQTFLAAVDAEFCGPDGGVQDWRLRRMAVASELRQAVREVEHLFATAVPEDPTDRYRNSNTRPGNLLAGLAEFWDRLEDLLAFLTETREFTASDYFDPVCRSLWDAQKLLLSAWRRLTDAFDKNDSLSVTLWASDVHDVLAEFLGILAAWANTLPDGEQMPVERRENITDEQWMDTLVSVAEFFETVVGLGHDVYSCAANLIAGTASSAVAHDIWTRTPAYRPLPAYLEGLTIWVQAAYEAPRRSSTSTVG